MTRYIIAYFATMVVFFAIDYVWLSRVATTFYRDQIGSILLDDFRIGWAAGFYLLYGVGIVVFAVRPGLDSSSVLLAAGLGALFGAMCYGTYDFTNLATVKAYTVQVAFVDFIWGTILTGVSAGAGCWLTMKFTS
ncbi:MAG: DUF2177 family protein [Pseudomonadota bacterium]